MQLRNFKTLWGHTTSIEDAALLAKAANFSGLEAPAVHAAPGHLPALANALAEHELEWIQEICTAGSYVPGAPQPCLSSWPTSGSPVTSVTGWWSASG